MHRFEPVQGISLSGPLATLHAQAHRGEHCWQIPRPGVAGFGMCTSGHARVSAAGLDTSRRARLIMVMTIKNLTSMARERLFHKCTCGRPDVSGAMVLASGLLTALTKYVGSRYVLH